MMWCEIGQLRDLRLVLEATLNYEDLISYSNDR